jgi:CheY-like chemotaxis protein
MGINVSPARILIVEDDVFTALDLEMIARDLGYSNVVIAGSVAAATAKTGEDVAFALLDIDVLDGKTFALADRLMQKRTPFAFVSASNKAELPPQLRDCTFIPKPYEPRSIAKTLTAALPPELA